MLEAAPVHVTMRTTTALGPNATDMSHAAAISKSVESLKSMAPHHGFAKVALQIIIDVTHEWGITTILYSTEESIEDNSGQKNYLDIDQLPAQSDHVEHYLGPWYHQAHALGGHGCKWNAASGNAFWLQRDTILRGSSKLEEVGFAAL